MLQRVREDPDATSRDLERAGDRARNFGQFTTALEFYDRAKERDPDNRSAALEYHCLLAEVRHDGRDMSLHKARELVVESANSEYLKRLANTYIALDRYADLRGLCETLLDGVEYRAKVDVQVFAHRNLAVALKEENDFFGAEEHLREALRQKPDDKGSLTALIGVLEEQERHDGALLEATRLVASDPTQGRFVFMLAEALDLLGRDAEAVEWYERAVDSLPEGSLRFRAIEEREKCPARHTMRDALNALAANLVATPNRVQVTRVLPASADRGGAPV